MRSITRMLDEDVEPRWRDHLREGYNSVWHDVPVRTDVTNYEDRPWQFYTDLETIYAEINDPAQIEAEFDDVVTQYWDGDAEELAAETMEYLLFHELYHPLESPSGREDARRTHQAIRRGVLEAEPDLSPTEQVKKVRGAQNAVKDFILDNRFYLDNKAAGYVRDDIIPTWDMMEIDRSVPDDGQTDMYTITRIIYGTLYGPESTFERFSTAAGDNGHALAEETMEAILESDVDLPESYISDAGGSEDAEQRAELEEYAVALRETFKSRPERYRAIEDMMAVLGPYVTESMPGAADIAGASNEQDILEDLLDDMGENEQDEFLDDLSDDLKGQNGDDDGDQTGGNGAGSPDTDTDIDALETATFHEYYRREHPRVTIRGGAISGEPVQTGTREYLETTRIHQLRERDLADLDMRAIAKLHERGIPALTQTGEDTYLLTEYDRNTEPVTDIRFEDTSLTVPDTVEIYLDSSGSMFNGSSFETGDDSRYDMALHAIYGMADTLRGIEDRIDETVSLRVHSFATSQVSSPIVTVDEFWDGNDAMLETLYRPDNGGNTEALHVQAFDDGADHAHVVITDGDVDNASQQVSNMQDRLEAGEQPVMIEIGGTYNMGKKIQEANLPYKQVHDKETLLENGLGLMLSPD